MSRNLYKSLLLFTIAVIMSNSSFGQPSDNHNYLMNDGTHYLLLAGSTATIKGDSDGLAVLDKKGNLTIAGKSIDESKQVRTLLIQYLDTAYATQTQSKAAIRQSIGPTIDLVGDIFEDVLSGQDNSQTDKDRDAKFDTSIHAVVAPICQDVGKLKNLQDHITKILPAFVPYAIVKRSDVSDCEN